MAQQYRVKSSKVLDTNSMAVLMSIKLIKLLRYAVCDSKVKQQRKKKDKFGDCYGKWIF